MMFESLSMMIPFSALMTAAITLLPLFGPRIPCPEPVTAPCAEPGQPPGTLQRHATHHPREGSPKFMWPLWTDLVLRKQGAWHRAEGSLFEQEGYKTLSRRAA